MSKQLIFYYSTTDSPGDKYEPVINEAAFDTKIESIKYKIVVI